MKKISILSASLFLLGNLCFAQAADPRPVITDNKPAATPAKPGNSAKKQRAVPFNGPVAAVDKTAKAVTVGKNKLRVFQITGESKINKDGKPSTLDQITVGELIGGSYRESADGKLEIVTLNAGERGKGKAKDEPRDKKKS